VGECVEVHDLGVGAPLALGHTRGARVAGVSHGAFQSSSPISLQLPADEEQRIRELLRRELAGAPGGSRWRSIVRIPLCIRC